jgi:hypothetical protein
LKFNLKLFDMKKQILIFVLFVFSLTTLGADFKVGLASKVITPELPFWMTGYGSRTRPADKVLHDIWAKAMVIEESPSSRVVIVTTDILGLSRQITQEVAKRVNEKYGIKRSELLLNSSHTHSGPAIWPALDGLFNLNQEDQQKVARYSARLTDDIVEIIGTAINNLAPMNISSGHGSAEFAMNRREYTPKGVINGKNPKGIGDHDVPVLKVTTPEGELKGILFGYACHNTTLSGYEYSGDYAGFAQIEIQKAHPGVTAMFFIGCGADQNPQPRGTIELATQHGKELASAVEKVLTGNLTPVRPPIRTAYETAELEFAPFTLESFQKDLLSSDKYSVNRAKVMVNALNKGWDLTKYQYPLQAIRFNKDLTIVGMAGETVVGYDLKLKKEYSKENLFVMGYCNEVMCYIPTKQIVQEGGYEPASSMIYYDMPGPFALNVEDRITDTLHSLMKKVGAKK